MAHPTITTASWGKELARGEGGVILLHTINNIRYRDIPYLSQTGHAPHTPFCSSLCFHSCCSYIMQSVLPKPTKKKPEGEHEDIPGCMYYLLASLLRPYPLFPWSLLLDCTDSRLASVASSCCIFSVVEAHRPCSSWALCVCVFLQRCMHLVLLAAAFQGR